MKKLQLVTLVLTLIVNQIFSFKASSQCTWNTQLFDGFEDTIACPYVIPGSVYTSIPQNYSVHGGNYSLYLNFVDCAGGTGTCAGDTVFKRVISACPNISLRISSYLTTTFSGMQCDMRMLILDANNNVLVNTASVVASFSPAWTFYQSGSFNPTTTSITFVMITNVDGGNGNDLSMDDFLVEDCQSTLAASFCPGSNYVFGSQIINEPGVYTEIYTTTAGCDSIVQLTLTSNVDTSVTRNGNMMFAHQTGPGVVYQWLDCNNSYAVITGATNQSFTPITNGSYAVRVTYNNCSDTSSCYTFTNVGMAENNPAFELSIFPNPANDFCVINSATFINSIITLYDVLGRELSKQSFNIKTQLDLSGLKSGMYFIGINDKEGRGVKSKLVKN